MATVKSAESFSKEFGDVFRTPPAQTSECELGRILRQDSPVALLVVVFWPLVEELMLSKAGLFIEKISSLAIVVGFARSSVSSADADLAPCLQTSSLPHVFAG